MNKKVETEGVSGDDAAEGGKVCGIVMPISAIGDLYTEEHWRRVRKVIQKAIRKSGLSPRLVWENSEVDVIHTAILKNIYENDVVVCDLSGLNPNVMLETGMRLSTRRPTVIITDKIDKPPFDVSTIGYIEYQKDLEFNSTEEFIERLSTKISSVLNAYEKKTYEPFVEKFTIETVTPQKITVPAEQYLKDQIDSIAQIVKRLDRDRRLMSDKEAINKFSVNQSDYIAYSARARFSATEDAAKMLVENLSRSGIAQEISITGNDNNEWRLQILPRPGLLRGAASTRIRGMAKQAGIEDVNIFFRSV